MGTRKRIKLPNLPGCIVKQPNGQYRCIKTLRWYSWSTLVRLYGTKEKTTLKSEVKQIKEHWTNKYDNY